MIDSPEQLLTIHSTMDPDYKLLFLKLANKIFRQGYYYRKESRKATARGDHETADQLDRAAHDMEFISDKAAETVPMTDRAAIQNLVAFESY